MRKGQRKGKYERKGRFYKSHLEPTEVIELYGDEEFDDIEITFELEMKWYEEWCDRAMYSQDSPIYPYYVQHFAWKSSTVKGKSTRECFLRFSQVREHQWKSRGVEVAEKIGVI